MTLLVAGAHGNAGKRGSGTRLLIGAVVTALLAVSTYTVNRAIDAPVTAEATVWVSQSVVDADGSTSAVSPAWVELLRSQQVLVPVVRAHGLDAQPLQGAPLHDAQAAATQLSDQLTVATSREGGFIRLGLTGSDARITEDVLNSVVDRFVELAAELERSRLVQTVEILEEQLELVTRELADAERSLERHRIGVSQGRIDGVTAMTEEERLVRQLRTTEGLYTEVRQRLERARLAAASVMPDLTVLDRAAASPRRSGPGFTVIGIGLGLLLLGLLTITWVRWSRTRPGASGSRYDERRLDGEVTPVLAIAVGTLMAVVVTGALLLF